MDCLDISSHAPDSTRARLPTYQKDDPSRYQTVQHSAVSGRCCQVMRLRSFGGACPIHGRHIHRHEFLHGSESAPLESFTVIQSVLQPERINGNGYTIRSDVWSTGIALLELVQNKFPFPNDLGPIDLIMHITRTPVCVDLDFGGNALTCCDCSHHNFTMRKALSGVIP
jgi:serine/threonine protein kinase